MPKAHDVLGAEIKKDPTSRDKRVAMILERSKNPVGAATVLFSAYCAEDPALMLSETAKSLKLLLFGSTERGAWDAKVAEHIQSEAALEDSARLDKHRNTRRMEPSAFLVVLHSELKHLS